MSKIFESAEQPLECYEVFPFIVSNRKEAEEVLDVVYAGTAVPYYETFEPSDLFMNAKEKRKEAEDKLEQYRKERSVLNYQSKTIGCRNCNSSLAKEYLKDDVCPVCGSDLRSQSAVDGEAQLKDKLREAEALERGLAEMDAEKVARVLYLYKTPEEDALTEEDLLTGDLTIGDSAEEYVDEASAENEAGMETESKEKNLNKESEETQHE